MIGGEQVYLPDYQEGQTSINIQGQEYHHLINVRRFRVGEQIWLVNGDGLSALTTIANIGSKSCELKILSEERGRGELNNKITLAVANLKGDHMNLVVEKATELGVYEIIPLLTDHTIKKGINLDRLNRIAIAAMKQSRRSRLPSIRELTKLEDLLTETRQAVHIFCHGDEARAQLVSLNEIKNSEHIYVFIGPEGDWSKDEIDLARNSDYTFTGLGPRRLRAETAAIHAVGLLSALLQDPA